MWVVKFLIIKYTDFITNLDVELLQFSLQHFNLTISTAECSMQVLGPESNCDSANFGSKNKMSSKILFPAPGRLFKTTCLPRPVFAGPVTLTCPSLLLALCRTSCTLMT